MGRVDQPVRIDLYTRDACPLCDEARDVIARTLARVPHEIAVHDIAADPDAEALYRYEIPVVLVDGVKRFVGHVNPALLRRLVDARQRNCKA